MKTKEIRLSIWKWDGTLVTGCSTEHYLAYAKRHLGITPDIGAHSCGHAYVEYGKPFVLWVDDLTNVPAIAHEAFHVAAGVLEGRGLKFTPESEEAYTYTMEAIVREMVNKKGWRAVRSR